MQRHGGVQRIADDVAEVEPAEPSGFGEAAGVDEHHRAERFGLGPEWLEGWIGQFQVANMCQHLDALEAQRFHGVFAVPRRCRRAAGLQRHRSHCGGYTIRHPGRDGRHALVNHTCRLDADLGRHVVVALRRSRTDHLCIHPHRVEVAHPQRQVQRGSAFGPRPACGRGYVFPRNRRLSEDPACWCGPTNAAGGVGPKRENGCRRSGCVA